MDFQEKIESLLNKRVLALTSKKGILDNQVVLEEERDFNNEFLFGDGTNKGVVNFFELYYRELYLSLGRTTTAPALQGGINTSESSYKTRFANAVDLNGDDATGFYPPDSNGIGAQDLYYGSLWFTTHDDQGQTIGGISGNADDLVTAATELYDRRQQDLTGGGVGGDEPDGNPDDPDYYNDVTPDNLYRSDLLNAFTTIIASLNVYKTYLDDVKSALVEVQNDSNELVNISESKSDYPLSDITQIETMQTNLQTQIDNFTTEYNYFNSFPATNNLSGTTGYNRTTFDNKLTTTIPNLESSLFTLLTNRETEVKAAISFDDISLGIRKWLVFWIAENIQKPSSPYVSLNGISTALAQAAKTISSSNSALGTLFGDPSQYITTPRSLAAYSDPRLDETDTIVEERITYLWLGNLISNKYKIYKRILNITETPSNDAWGEEYFYDWQTELNEETNAISTEYTDSNITTGNVYAYRVQSFDQDATVSPISPQDRTDSFDSSSLQSNMYNPTGYVISSIVDGLITVTEEHDILEGTFIAIIDSTGNDGYYFVSTVTATKILLENTSINGNDGTIHQAFGLVRF